MQLVKYPNPILLEKSRPVTEFNGALKNFAQEMVNFAGVLPWGIPLGLAAPQVGRNIRLFLKARHMGQRMGFEVFINPEIEWETNAPKDQTKEGCYSLEEGKLDYPNLRSRSLRLKWQDLEGNWHGDRFNGLSAHVVQHEIEHLDGILCNRSELEIKQ